MQSQRIAPTWPNRSPPTHSLSSAMTVPASIGWSGRSSVRLASSPGGANPERKGLVFFIPGFGISKEMTDVFDCIRVGIAERGPVIKLKQYDNKKGKDEFISMGRIGDLVEKAQSPAQNKDLFRHFSEALRRHENEI